LSPGSALRAAPAVVCFGRAVAWRLVSV